MESGSIEKGRLGHVKKERAAYAAEESNGMAGRFEGMQPLSFFV